MSASRQGRQGFFGGTFALAILSALMMVAACSNTPQQQQPGAGAPPQPAPAAAAPAVETGPRLTASPNPLPGGPGFGTTTISWSTGDGSGGKVYVVAAGEQQKLFASGASGSMEAPWIGDK